MLLSDDMKSRHRLNEREIIAAATLPELDDAYTRRVHNFPSVTQLYKWSSSINYLNNISCPMLFINARDDPIVPPALLDPIKKFASEKQNIMYLELAHGGHLGFYEGGLLYPNPVTWLDRALVALIGSLVFFCNEGTMKNPNNTNLEAADDTTVVLDSREKEKEKNFNVVSL